MDILNRISILLGPAAMARLRNSTVMVAGCGAVGSFAIEALARSGVGRIIVLDFDRIEESNINRQLFALHTTIGQPKVEVAAARIRDINPDIDVIALDTFFDASSDIPLRPDFVIDAIDTVESKIALYKWCIKHDIAFISSMGAALKRDISQIRRGSIYHTSVCPLAAKVRRIARGENLPDFPVVYSTEPPRVAALPGRALGSIITVTGVFGLMLADGAIEYITTK